MAVDAPHGMAVSSLRGTGNERKYTIGIAKTMRSAAIQHVSKCACYEPRPQMSVCAERENSATFVGQHVESSSKREDAVPGKCTSGIAKTSQPCRYPECAWDEPRPQMSVCAEKRTRPHLSGSTWKRSESSSKEQKLEGDAACNWSMLQKEKT